MAYEYNTWFLVVDGGSGLWIIIVYGTPFSIGTADQVNSYLREAAITFARVPGLSSQGSLHARNLAKTIARDKPVSTLNVLANIKNTGII